MGEKEYYVEIPLTGMVSGTIIAESEEEAIDILAEQCTSDDMEWGVDASRGTAIEGADVEDDEEEENTTPPPSHPK